MEEDKDIKRQRYLDNLKSQLIDLEKQRKINKINYYLVNYTVIGQDNCSL